MHRPQRCIGCARHSDRTAEAVGRALSRKVLQCARRWGSVFLPRHSEAKDPDTPVETRVLGYERARMPDRRTNLREYLECIESSRQRERPRLASLRSFVRSFDSAISDHAVDKSASLNGRGNPFGGRIDFWIFLSILDELKIMFFFLFLFFIYIRKYSYRCEKRRHNNTK